MAVSLTINGTPHQLDATPDMPLLWAIRDLAGLTGTKYGCGVAQCGACSVLVNGELMRSCSVTMQDAAGKMITTIEGIGDAADKLHPLQQAWIDHQVPQCGYCQSGQIMAALALLKSTPKPTDSQIDEAMTNICRCGTYPRIRAAIHAVAGA